MIEMPFSELAFLNTYLASQILFIFMPSSVIKQSAHVEMRRPLIEVEMYAAELVHTVQCPMDPRNSTDVLPKHFISIVKSCSVELVWMISKLVCSKLAWVPQHCAMQTNHREKKAMLAWPFGCSEVGTTI